MPTGPHLNPAQCLQQLKRGALVLTANNRLSRALLESYHQHQRASGDTSWLRPDIWSYSQWIEARWQQLQDQGQASDRILAPDIQIKQLWQQIIDNDPKGTELINSARLASEAYSADQILHRWQISTETLEAHQQSDTDQRFADWRKNFQNLCSIKRLHTPETLQEELLQAFTQGYLPAYTTIVTYGFDELTPLSSALLLSATSQCLNCEPLAENSQAVSQQLYRCDSEEDEIRAAANWAVNLLQQQRQVPDSPDTPSFRLAIISPQAKQQRGLFERIFMETFEPDLLTPVRERRALPFNFSAGISLGETPIVADALDVLHSYRGSLNLDQLTRLLNSPFLPWGNVSTELSLLLKEMRLRARTEIRLNDVIFLSEKIRERPSQTSQETQENWHQIYQTLTYLRVDNAIAFTKQSAASWADLFDQHLERLGWPGQRILDTYEYQQVASWYDLLTDFSGLEASGDLYTIAEARSLLTELASSREFQVQTPDSPIQILGALEASGLNFSHVWVTGMNQQQWPPTSQPNALLPISLQREHQTPHCDAHRELTYARRLTENFRRSAQHLVFSYAAKLEDDDQEQQPSRLLSQLHVESAFPQACDSDSWQSSLEKRLSPESITLIDISSAPPVHELEKRLLRSLSNLLKWQALAPPAAFAFYRLGADQESLFSLGLTPMQRGNVMHNTLAEFWRETKTKSELVQLSSAEREQRLTLSLDRQLAESARREPHILGKSYLQLERQRQLALINAWLTLEEERQEFSVAAIEADLATEFMGIDFRLRLDRVDRLADGRQLIVDYKSGQPDAKGWRGDRLEEPQLPLYTRCYDGNLCGIAYGQLNPKAVKFIAMGDLIDEIPGVLNSSTRERLGLAGSWQDNCQRWEEWLAQTLTEFLQGEFPLRVKHPLAESRLHFLRPLLRWQDAPLLSNSNDLP